MTWNQDKKESHTMFRRMDGFLVNLHQTQNTNSEITIIGEENSIYLTPLSAGKILGTPHVDNYDLKHITQ